LKSIRRGLLVWLAVALAAGMAIAVLATYFFAYAQINQVFDEELVLIAEAVHLGGDWRAGTRVRIPRPGFNLSVRAYDAAGLSYFDTAQPSMPADIPRLRAAGHSVVATTDGDWRLYTHVTSEGFVQVAQPEATRAALARALAVRLALPELVSIPLLLGFVGWVLRRGLSPIGAISRRVEQRDAARLDPLPTDDVPEELLPLITEINALLARLEVSLSSQRRFVEDAAHELRTPVAALALQAQVAGRATEPTERAAAFGELDKGIARATRVVQQLLRLAQVGNEQASEPLVPVDLARIARDVVGFVALQAARAGVDLGAETDAAAFVGGSEPELVSLITNLVDNAIRYSPPGSEVTVAVRREGAVVRLTVTDPGPGLPASERAAVFQRFHRRRGDGSSGVGLGLAIVKAIVDRHGGTIVLADAAPGTLPPGLKVTVTFPAIGVAVAAR
jgi:two-component system, OmpR family, sensor kinase